MMTMRPSIAPTVAPAITPALIASQQKQYIYVQVSFQIKKQQLQKKKNIKKTQHIQKTKVWLRTYLEEREKNKQIINNDFFEKQIFN